jgi:hypothetical protein
MRVSLFKKIPRFVLKSKKNRFYQGMAGYWHSGNYIKKDCIFKNIFKIFITFSVTKKQVHRLNCCVGQ